MKWTRPQPHPLFKLATELGPLLVFFVANAKFHLFVATGAFMVAVVAAMIASYVVTRHVPIMALVTGIIVIVFGTLTLVLHDETFIKVKPTIIYGLFAAVLGGGLLFGRSFIAVMFDQMFNLTPQGWRILTLRWALFFFAHGDPERSHLAHPDHRFLGGFKAFGVIPLTMIFAITQMPLIKRYHLEPASLEVSEAKPGCAQGLTLRLRRRSAWRSRRFADGSRRLRLRQRLVDLGLEHGVDIVRRDRADQLVDDGAVAPDDEGFRHAIDAPFDRGAAVAVDADNAERIAVAAEEAPGVVGRVLVVDADQLQPLVLAELGQQRRFVMARHAPGGPDVDDADLALEHGGIEPGHRRAVVEQGPPAAAAGFAAPGGRSGRTGFSTDRRRRAGTRTAPRAPRRRPAAAPSARTRAAACGDVGDVGSMMGSLISISAALRPERRTTPLASSSRRRCFWRR